MLKYLHYIFLLLTLLLVNCVSEEDIFSEEIRTPIETSIILSTFDYIKNTTDQSEKCFEFIFPISILDNKENNITFFNKDGLGEFNALQSNNFFPCSITFPFKVKPKDANELSINNIDEFSNLLETCNITSLNKRIFNETNCFEFEYPIEIVSETNKNNKLVIANEDQLNEFATNPTFEYPITTYPLKSNQGAIITNKFEHLTVLNDCEIALENKVCPDFMIQTIDFGTESSILNFIIRPENDKVPTTTEWSIDGEIIEDETRAFLQYDFFELIFSSEIENERFEVCAKTSFEDCTIEKEVCIIASFEEDIDEACKKDIDFIATEDPTTPGLFNFEALFISDDPTTTTYIWSVNGEPTGDIFNVSSFQFTQPGIFAVCLVAREIGAECATENSSFPSACKIITINDDLSAFNCRPSVNLFSEKDTTTPGKYNFQAIYESLDLTKITYTWSLDNRIVIGNDTNEFSSTFLNSNTHEVCVIVNNPECPEDTLIRQCEIITVTDND